MKRKYVAVIKIVILSFVFLVLMPQTALAQHWFMNINGIQGESHDKDHKNWIDVISFSPDISRSIPAGATGGRAGSGDFQIVKRIDRASSALNRACASGKSIPLVTLKVRKAGGKPGYIRYAFQNVVIRSVNPGGSGGSVPTESISFNYASVTWTYIPQEGDKSKSKGSSKTTYDLQKSEP